MIGYNIFPLMVTGGRGFIRRRGGVGLFILVVGDEVIRRRLLHFIIVLSQLLLLNDESVFLLLCVEGSIGAMVL